MDKKAASLILKLRIPFLVLVCLLTVFFAWRATHLKLSYDFEKLLPRNHPYVKTYQEFQEVFGGANLITLEVAARQGVERITYISGATVAEENRWSPLEDRKFLAEKAIRESGIPYTILCPTWVMESLAMFVVQGQAAVFGKQPCPYHWVSADDIARMVVTAYNLGAEANGRFIVHGPEAIRMQEAVMRYCVTFHPEIKKVSSMPFWLVKLMATVTNNQGLKAACELFSYFEKVGEWRNLPQANCVLGTPAMTLDRWLESRKSLGAAGALVLQPAR